MKGNSILYNFSRNRENQISIFSRLKMQFKLPLKIVTFFLAFSVIFENFHGSYFFLYPNCFSKEQIRCHKGKLFFFLIS